MKKKLFVICILLLSGTIVYAQEDKKPEKLETTISARVYFDGSAFVNNNEEYVGSGSSISDIRLGASGKYQDFEGKVDIGFAKKTVSFKDVYLQYNFNKSSYTRIGNFAEPIGIDYMESSANIRFIDAGIVMQAFCPGRNLGLEYIGWSKNLWYAGGIFGDNNYADRSKIAGNDGYGFTGRLVLNPLREPGKIFHVGVAGSYRVPNANALTVTGSDRSVSYGNTLGSPINATKFISATVTDAKSTTKAAFELMTACNKVNFQGELFYTQTNRRDDLETYKAKGAYAQVSILAIGDNYKYADNWARYALPKPGSLEFAARFSHVNLDCSDAKIMGGIQNQYTFACNYYWKSFVRLRLNYDIAHVKGLKSFNFLTARVQVFL
jgi:phosphate-selective porin OprO/OprP